MIPKAPDGKPSRPGGRPGSAGASSDAGEEKHVEIAPSELEYGEAIGSGATAEVFKGVWRGQTVAIKEIKGGSHSALKLQVSFTRELAVLSKCHHPNLCCFCGACLEATPLRLVTEFCAGGTLFELLHNSDLELSWAQSLKMCKDIATGMHYLHSSQPMIIHRDLKSLNVLLHNEITSDKVVPLTKVADFGTARMKELDAEWEKLTKKAGTCHWMAPEVLNGRYDEKADVYSYSMVLFEIICREIPFEDHEANDVVGLTAKGERPDLEAVPPDCPPSLRQLMIRSWDHTSANRPAFTEVLDILDKVGAK